MSELGPLATDHGREAFGTACGLAVVSGALSVVVPLFDVLTATLVALAVAGWAAVHRRGSSSLGGSVWTYAGALSVLGASAAVFVDAPPPTAPWRAFLLGLAVVPLWAVEQRAQPWRSRRGGGP